ncbi:hypothetical protein C8R45DRAFT_1010418, partial [Mycena sanguinolenta]
MRMVQVWYCGCHSTLQVHSGSCLGDIFCFILPYTSISIRARFCQLQSRTVVALAALESFSRGCISRRIFSGSEEFWEMRREMTGMMFVSTYSRISHMESRHMEYPAKIRHMESPLRFSQMPFTTVNSCPYGISVIWNSPQTEFGWYPDFIPDEKFNC